MIRVGIPTFGTDHGKSGIGSYLRELLMLCNAIVMHGEFSFEIIGPKEDADFYLKGLEAIDWYEVEGADASPIHNYFWNQLQLPKIVRERSYDLVFFPAANRRLSGRLSTPTVGTVHDLAVLHMKEKYDFVHTFFNRRMLPRLIRRLDHILTVSDFSKQDIVRFVQVKPETVTVTHLAADAKRFQFPDDREAVRKDLAERYRLDAPFVLYISRLEHPGKNHVGLIRAYDRMRAQLKERYLLVLPGPDKERAQEIHAEARKSAYADDIRFLGFVPWDDIPCLYQGASLFVLPSRFEGFGLPLLEAMACGTPVISSDAASLVEIGGPQTPRFKPDDINRMALLMLSLLTDGTKAHQLIEENAQWAAQFSWSRTIEQTLDAFRTTVSDQKRRS